MVIMKEKKIKKAPKKPILSPEDIEIWGKATKDVTNLDRSNQIPPKTSPIKTHQKPKLTSGKISLEISEPRIPVHHPSSFQMDGNLRKKFEAGELEIDGKIDLHGLTLAEAHHQFTRFMIRHIKNNARFLLVITGKGGQGGIGVIRQNLPLWCDDNSIKHHILSFKPAKPKHGGEGACYIFLRKQKM